MPRHSGWRPFRQRWASTVGMVYVTGDQASQCLHKAFWWRSRGCQSHPSDYKIIETGNQSLTFCGLSGLAAFMSELKSWRVFWQSLFLWKGRLENCNLSVVIKFLTISVLNQKRIATIFGLCFPVPCDNLGQRLDCRPPSGMKSNHPMSSLSQKQ